MGSKLIDLCEGKEIKQKQKIKKGKKNWTFRQLTGLLQWSLITKKCCKKTYMWWFDNTTAITNQTLPKHINYGGFIHRCVVCRKKVYLLWQVYGAPLQLILMPLKHVYCSSLYSAYRHSILHPWFNQEEWLGWPSM